MPVLSIRHVTRLSYSHPVVRSVNTLRLTPKRTQHQHPLRTSIGVSPRSLIRGRPDVRRNRVHSVVITEPHTELIIEATSVVETSRPDRVTVPSFWAAYRKPPAWVAAYAAQTSFTEPGGVVLLPRAGSDAWAHSLDLIRAVRERVAYRKGVTTVSSTASDVLAGGAGVCQDLSHVTIGLLRAQGIPTRYVGGYRHVGDVHEPHAWIEVWHGTAGWVAVDPTSGEQTDERYVRCAVGADYDEASPVEGVVTYAFGVGNAVAYPPEVTVQIAAMDGEGERSG